MSPVCPFCGFVMIQKTFFDPCAVVNCNSCFTREANINLHIVLLLSFPRREQTDIRSLEEIPFKAIQISEWINPSSDGLKYDSNDRLMIDFIWITISYKTHSMPIIYMSMWIVKQSSCKPTTNHLDNNLRKWALLGIFVSRCLIENIHYKLTVNSGIEVHRTVF